jgi:hypothetical protein
MATTAAEASALWMVAVTTALVKTRTAKMAAKPTTVRRAFKARITDTHVLYAGTLCGQNGRRDCRVPACLYLSCGQAERCLNWDERRRPVSATAVLSKSGSIQSTFAITASPSPTRMVSPSLRPNRAFASGAM